MANEGFAATSQARRLSAIRQFFAFSIRKVSGRMTPPVSSMPQKQKPLPKIMSVENVGRLLDRTDLEAKALEPADLIKALRLHALLETLYATGLRVSELVGLPASVARTDHRFLIVRGKGSKDRMVPLSQKAREALQRFLSLRDSCRATTIIPGSFRLFLKAAIWRARFSPVNLKVLLPAPGFQAPRSPRMCCAMPLPATFYKTVLT